MGDGGRAEAELGKAPDDVGHDGGNGPSPSQDGVDFRVDGNERALSGREGDVTDGAKHDHPEDDCHRL